jgi:hypothetical protein
MFYIAYYRRIIKGRCFNMNKLINKFKKVTKKDNREWYTADMLAPSGNPYRRGVKATSKAEAAGLIVLNMPEGSKIVNVEKGDL